MRNKSAFFCTLLSALSILLSPVVAPAQTPLVASRVTQAVDETRLTTLSGNTHPLALPQFDRGAAPPSLPMDRMLLVLKRSPGQEAALDALLDQQQDTSSPNYHQWLTSDQFGQQFGPSDQDIRAVTSWLQSHGFQVAGVSRGRTTIEFSGTASEVQEAFHASIHKYTMNGEDHWANSSDPQIPSALAPVVAGVNTLHNFPREAMHHVAGPASRSRATSNVTPAEPSLFTLGGDCGVPGVGCHGVGPFDFATIYNVLPLWTAAPTPINGAGQTIAIVGESDINTQDVAAFRNYFGLSAPNLQVIVNGPDPGIVQGDETESDLDVEWAGAVAPDATIDFVTSQSTETSSGVDLSAEYIVDNNLAPVLSESYGLCELFLGTAGNQFYNQLWQQGAAQGITILLSTGDSGSAVCDRMDKGSAPRPAAYGLSVSGLSSTPYNVAVGGTDFNDLTNPSSYWAATNSTPPLPGNPSAPATVSALSYIPETTWNNTCTNSVFGTLLDYSTNAETNCNNAQLTDFVVTEGGSGGSSSCTNSNGQSVSSCLGGYAKPSWQTGAGVPNDGKRDVPDVSLYSAVGSPSGSSYIICESDLVPGESSCDPTNPDTYFILIGGTSASTPSFAGIMALVNQETQTRQGNANYVLYKLAAQQPGAFHDAPTGGTIAMPCATGSTPDCITQTTGDLYGVLSGYNTTSGYDLATGLGSINAYNLVTNWNITTGTKGTVTSLTISPANSPIVHGTAVPINITVMPNPPSPGTPTGQVSLITSTGESAGSFTLGNNGSLAPGTTASLLPGGNYTVTAHYGGDATFRASDSSPIAVTVGPEASKVEVAYELFNPTTRQETNPNATTAAFGTPAILRINVTSSAGDACPQNALGESGCPTGNVTVTDNGNPLDAGTYALNVLGYAEDQSIFLTGGTHSIIATYPVSDGSYSAPASTTDVITIQKAATSVVLSPATQTIGGNTNGQLSATINTNISLTNSVHVPTGNMQFFMDGVAFQAPVPVSGSINPQTGIAQAESGITLNTSAISSGNHAFTAQYLGDSNYAAAATTGPVAVIVQASTTTALASSNLTPLAGTPVTFTSQVAPAQPDGSMPTGSVAFTASAPQGFLVTAVATLSNGQAQAVLALPAGSVPVMADYTGDTNYAQSVSATITETVAAIGTSMTLTSSNLSPQVGTNVVFTATVTPTQSGGPPVTGIVGFKTSGGLPLGNSGVSNGEALLTTDAFPAGSNTVVATYLPDNDHTGSNASVTEIVSIGDTTTTVSSSNSTITQLSTVTFTAQVNPANPSAPTPTGNVQFTANGLTIGSSGVSNGKAQIGATALPIGSIPIVATYNGDTNYSTSSGTSSETVIVATTSTSVTTSSATITQGSSVTLTAVVMPTQTGAMALAGSVQFFSNGSDIGNPVKLSSGQAQLITTALPVGSDQITATYSSDPNYSNSTSPAIAETVTPPPTFTVTANPTAINVSAPGQTGSTVLTFTSQNGLAGMSLTVSAGCSLFPSESNCSFSPTSVVTSTTINLPANGSTTATFYVITTAPSATVPTTRNRPGASGRWTRRDVIILECVLCTALLMLGFRGRRLRLSTAFAIIALALMIANAACGGGGSSSGGGGGNSGGGGGGGGNPGTPLTQNAPIGVSITIGGISQTVPNLTITVQ